MDASGLAHRDLTERVIGAFYSTYNELGFGFLESVYENAFAIQLEECGLRVQRQHPISVAFRGHVVGEKATGSRLGLLANFGPRPQFRRMVF